MPQRCRERFPRRCGLAIPTCITTRAWRICRYAYRNRYLAVSFEVGGGENVPGIPGACATCNFYVSGKRPMIASLRVLPMIDILPQFLQWCIQYHVILDRAMTTHDCTWAFWVRTTQWYSPRAHAWTGGSPSTRWSPEMFWVTGRALPIVQTAPSGETLKYNAPICCSCLEGGGGLPPDLLMTSCLVQIITRITCT